MKESRGERPLEKQRDTSESDRYDKKRQARQPPSKGSLALFAALSLAAGVMLLLVARLPRAIASLGWPATEGVVISSEVAESGLYTDESWYPHVSYRYSVNGEEYTSEEIEVIQVANSSTDYYANQVVERYPKDKRVEVHYDPGNPAIAVLEPGVPDNGVFASILFFACVGGGLVLLCVGLLSVVGLAKWKDLVHSFGQH